MNIHDKDYNDEYKRIDNLLMQESINKLNNLKQGRTKNKQDATYRHAHNHEIDVLIEELQS